MLAQLIVSMLISQGSKKAVYFLYSADLGGTILIGITFLIFGGGDGIVVFIAAASYVLYFFNVGRKSYTDENAKTFAINLLKWSAISLPVELALVGLTVLIAFSSFK
ncbi:MAG: hypothetical protein O6829_00520 [Alphaproteobacteria bacterium]|nr:hypothetical protein [Alphaproteobacteria bacterium]